MGSRRFAHVPSRPDRRSHHGVRAAASLGFAQATIAGVVRDASAAVLPGVTVEASSPVLIEKARTVVSDGTGQYRITDLPPGTYMLTFTLPGFTTVRREGLAVSGSGVIPHNAELARRRAPGNRHRDRRVADRRHAVGAPRGGAQQRDAEHAARHARLRLGARRRPGAQHRRRRRRGRHDGADDAHHDVLHRPRRRERRRTGDDQRPDRRPRRSAAAASSDVTYDTANAEEMQVLISGGLGEAETGGPSINIVPASRAATSSAARRSTARRATGRRPNNVDDRLRGFGITRPPTLRTNWDVSGSIGGPIVRDRLWFFGNVRDWGNAAVVDGIFANRYAGDASHWDYAPIPAIEARQTEGRKIYRRPASRPRSRQRNRVTFSHDYQRRCDGSTLRSERRRVPPGGRRLGRERAHVRRRHGVAGDVSGLPRLPVQHDAGHLLRAAHQPHRWSRAATRASPTATRASAWPRRTGCWISFRSPRSPASTGGRNLSYRGVFDPLDFGFNDNKALQLVLAGVALLRHRRAQPQGRLHRATSPTVHNGRVPERHAAALHVQRQRPIAAACTTRTAIACARSASPTSSRRAGISTTGRRRPALYVAGPVDGRAVTLQGGAPLRPGLELGAGRRQRHHRARRASTRSRSRSSGRSASAATTTSRRGSGVAYDVFGNGRTAIKLNVGKYVEAATSDVIYSANNPAARIVTRIGSGQAPRHAAGPTATATSRSTATC